MSQERNINSEWGREEYLYHAPYLYAIAYDGKRCPVMNIICEGEGKRLIPFGWVVDGKAPLNDFWGAIYPSAVAIPLKTGSRLTPHSILAGFYFRKLSDRYGDDLIMVLIPDDETFERWAARPVKLSDLATYKENPCALLKESLDLQRLGDDLGADMKRHTYMLLTASIDTK